MRMHDCEPRKLTSREPKSSMSSTSPRLRLSDRRLRLRLAAHSMQTLIWAIPKLCCQPRRIRDRQGTSLKLLPRISRSTFHLGKAAAPQRGNWRRKVRRATNLTSVRRVRKSTQGTVSLPMMMSQARYRSPTPNPASNCPARRGLSRTRS